MMTSATGNNRRIGAYPSRGALLASGCLTAALMMAGCGVAERRPEALPVAPAHAIAEVAARQAAVTAHPLATRAALEMLDRGGSAVDAAIAAQMVLGLVEPQSSGIGGGTLAMVWDAKSRKLASYDGLAAAPSLVTPGLAVDVDGSALDDRASQRGGRTVGVPGTLSLFKALHTRHGVLPWAALFAPAIALADDGYPLPRYLANVLSQPGAAADHPDMVPLYFGADGKVLQPGTTVRNPAYARTLRAIAELGPAGWLRSGAARDIVAAARRGYRPSLMTEEDLLAYRAEERDPVCAPFRVYSVCVMGPSSFGGVAVLQVVRMLDILASPNAPGGAAPIRFDFDDQDFAHVYVEAGRLAQADRMRYLGDPGFVTVPVAQLIADGYLRERARAIDRLRAAKDPAAGVLAIASTVNAPDPSDPVSATSQIAVVDANGNALSVTTTINLNFGSRLMVNGFVLNNALTNFAPAPRPGQVVANRMASGKRPVTSMAPAIVFDATGAPVLVGGSAGGGQIVDYIAQGLIEMLANGRTPAQALARGHVSTAVRGKVQLEQGTAAEALAAGLAAKGHATEVAPMTSGLGFLMWRGGGWIGAADPRRDGVAMGN